MHVEIWSDVVCPWCYLGKKRFERALEAFEHRDEVTVEYRSFELDPTVPRGRTTPTVDLLAGKYGKSADEAAEGQRAMTERAAAEGLAFRMDGLHSGNTRDAHRLLHLAKKQGRQAELVEGLHRAYFTEQRSLFESGSLTEIAVESGLDADEVSAVLAGHDYLDEVRADQEDARELGVDGVPFFVFDRRYAVSGAQPAEAMSAALAQAYAG